MQTKTRKLLLVQVAALGWDFLQQQAEPESSLRWSPLDPVFPAVTCTVQASLRTALPPSRHGMIANGLYLRNLRKPMFWEQSSALVDGERIWQRYRDQGHTVGMMFWQQSLGEDVDLLLSPKPIHTHSGRLIQDCYTQPHDLYAEICAGLGRRFNLMRYWGPLASHVVGEWIVDATVWVMRSEGHAPDLLCTYLPSLDYDLQRHGPDSRQARTARMATLQQIQQLKQAAEQNGYDIVVVGDYAIDSCGQGVGFPNRALHEQGLFTTRIVKGRSYPDFHAARAFAMVDHEVAHVYLQHGTRPDEVAPLLSAIPEVDEVLPGHQQDGLDHAHCGDLVLTAKPGCWFAYPWWDDTVQPPDYASHIDIHNKPGFDPCEIFWGWPPPSVSQNAYRIRGSHGRVGPGRQVAFASTADLGGTPKSQLELAELLKQRLV